MVLHDSSSWFGHFQLYCPCLHGGNFRTKKTKTRQNRFASGPIQCSCHKRTSLWQILAKTLCYLSVRIQSRSEYHLSCCLHYPRLYGGYYLLVLWKRRTSFLWRQNSRGSDYSRCCHLGYFCWFLTMLETTVFYIIFTKTLIGQFIITYFKYQGFIEI